MIAAQPEAEPATPQAPKAEPLAALLRAVDEKT